MPWDNLPKAQIHLHEPQHFGTWIKNSAGPCFYFNPHYTSEKIFEFISDVPLTIILDENCHIKIVENLPQVTYQLYSSAQLDHCDRRFDQQKIQFTLNSYAQLTHFTPAILENDTQRTVDIFLKGSEASVQWNTSVWLKYAAIYAETVNIEHEADHTHSQYMLKSVIEEAGVLKMNCDVTIQKVAFGSSAYQKNLNYVLNRQGRVITQPRLHIFNRNIEASHGTATQPIPQEVLFYLRSRGLSHSDAQRLFLESFLEILDERE